MGKEVIRNLMYFALFVAMDQLSKKIGHSLNTFHLNHGVMLGLLKDSSFFFRLTTLSSIFGFLAIVLAISLFMLN